MYCKKCGQELPDDAENCTYCGCKVDNTNPNDEKYNTNKNLLGFLCGLFLGILGIIIGLFVYPEKTIARKSFIKAWCITVFSFYGFAIIIGLLSSLL